jgi:hypothetical protein
LESTFSSVWGSEGRLCIERFAEWVVGWLVLEEGGLSDSDLITEAGN